MNTKKPIVSIITPVYNASKFIPRLLESVLKQELIIYEHILVDDCSQDNSYAILMEAAVKNPHIKVIRLSNNSGPIVARNKALNYATGKYLAFLDADDYWMPSKLSTQVRFMEKNDAALSFSDYRFISEDGSLIGRRISGFNKIGWSIHHITRYLGCLTVMVNREKVPYFKFPDISSTYKAEDFLAWSYTILKTGPALRCPHDLARYAQVSNSRSSLAFNAAQTVWKVYHDVEKIPFFKALPLFLLYAFFATYKRFWFKPRIQSWRVDGEDSKSYLLGELE